MTSPLIPLGIALFGGMVGYYLINRQYNQHHHSTAFLTAQHLTHDKTATHHSHHPPPPRHTTHNEARKASGHPHNVSHASQKYSKEVSDIMASKSVYRHTIKKLEPSQRKMLAHIGEENKNTIPLVAGDEKLAHLFRGGKLPPEPTHRGTDYSLNFNGHRIPIGGDTGEGSGTLYEAEAAGDIKDQTPIHMPIRPGGVIGIHNPNKEGYGEKWANQLNGQFIGGGYMGNA